MNGDLERYLNEGKLPPCSNCHKRDGVKTTLRLSAGEYYLEWLCSECLEPGHFVKKSAACPNCKKPLTWGKIYLADESLFCSKECAIEYEGYYGIDHWNKVAEEFEKNIGKKIHIS